MSESVFALDANVFIQAHREYYAFDVAPRFWEKLIFHANSGHIVIIDRILKELENGNDELSRWAKGNLHELSVSTDSEDVIKCFSDIMNWVNNQNQFQDAAKHEFARGADGWLVAFVKANRLILVTHEEFRPEIKKKVPIPNVCHEFDVPYIKTFEMLRRLSVQL